MGALQAGGKTAMRKRKGLKKKALISGIVFIVVCIAALLFLSSSPFESFLWNRIDRILSDRFGLAISKKDFRFDPLRLCLHVSDLRVQPRFPGQIPLDSFTADRLEVDLPLSTLLKRKLHIQKLHITQPSLNIRADRTTSPDRAPTSPDLSVPSAISLDFRIDDFRLEDGFVNFGHERLGLQVSLSHLFASLRHKSQDQTHMGSLSAEGGSMRWGNNHWMIRNIQLETTIEKQDVIVRRFWLDSDITHIEISGRVHDLPAHPRFELSVQATQNLEGLSVNIPGTGKTAGTIELEGSVSGETRNLRFSGKMHGQDIVLSGLTFPALSMALTGTSDHVDISDLRLEAAGGRVDGKAEISLRKDGRSTARLDLKGISSELLIQAVAPQMVPLSCRLSGHLSAGWTGIDPGSLQGDAELCMSPLSTDESSPSFPLQGAVDLKVENGEIQITSGEFSLPGGRIHLSGTADLKKNIRAKLTLESPNLNLLKQAFSPYLSSLVPDKTAGFVSSQIDGRISLLATIAGQWPEPGMEIELRGRDIQLNQLQVDSLDLVAAREQDRIRISRFELESVAGNISGSGHVFIIPSNRIPQLPEPLALTLSRLNLSKLADFFPRGIDPDGMLSGEVRIMRSISDPLIDFHLLLSEAQLKGQALKSAEFQGNWYRRRLDLKQFEIHQGEISLAGRLFFDTADRAYSIELEGTGIQPADFQALPTIIAKLSGHLDFSIHGQGTLGRPSFDLSLAWKEPGFGNFRASRMDLKARSDGQTVKVHIEIPEGQTELEFEAALPRPTALTGHFKTSGLDLFTLLSDQPQNLAARSELSLTAEFFLNLTDYQKSKIHVRGERFFLEHQHMTLQNDKPFEIGLEAGKMFFRDFNLEGQDMELTLSGNLPIKEGKDSRLEANLHLDLAILEPFFPESHISGKLDVQSNIRGSLTVPVLSGTTILHSGAWSSPQIPIDIHDTRLMAELKNNTVMLKDLHIGIGQGSLTGEGGFSLSDFIVPAARKPLRDDDSANHLTLTLQNLDPADFFTGLPAYIQDDLFGDIDAVIHLKGRFDSLSALKMEGEVSHFMLGMSDIKLENDQKIRFILEDGRLRLSEFSIKGKNSDIRGAGQVKIAPDPEIDFRLKALLNAAELAPLMEDIVTSGTLSLDVSASGPLREPALQGHASLEKGFIQFREYNVVASDLTGEIQISEKGIHLTSLKGNLNGGSVTVSGNLNVSGLTVESGHFTAEAERVYVTYPEGFQAQGEGRFTLDGKGSQWTLSGDIHVAQSYYSQDIYPGKELWTAIRYRKPRSISNIAPLMRTLNLDLSISLKETMLIDNNLADLELDGNVQVKGTPLMPLLSGYIFNTRIGEMYVGGRTYQVERFNLEFPDKEIQEAILNMTAITHMKHNYEDLEITLNLSGPLNRLSYSLSSSPPPSRSQTELAALLITGYGTERLRSEATNIIGNQMILYFTSPLASPLTNRIRDFLKAEEVSLEPINVATQEDPSARFTFRKGLIKNTDLVYSIDIGNTQQQTWILDYNLSRNLSVQGFQRDDGTYGASLRHRFYPRDLLFWKKKPPSDQSVRPLIREIEYSGTFLFNKDILASKAGRLKPGNPFDYRILRRTTNRLIDFYKKNGYINIIVEPRITQEKNRIQVVFDIAPRETARIEFIGAPLSRRVKKDIIKTWNGRIPEAVRISEAETQLRRTLQQKGYFEAEVEVVRKNRGQDTVYTFSVQRGIRYHPRHLTLNQEIILTPEIVKKSLSGIPYRKGHPYWLLLTDFRRARRRILDLLAERGFQDPRIKRPEYTIDTQHKKVDFFLEIQPGPQTYIRSVSLQGVQAFPEKELKKNLQLAEHTVFRPSVLAEDNNRLLNFYRERGFQDVFITVEVLPSVESDVEIVYTFEEGQLHIIHAIDITGNLKIPDTFIRRELQFREGDPVNIEKLILSQKNLSDLSIFRSVNIRRSPLQGSNTLEVISVEVKEEETLALGYGLRYSSEEKFEGFGQVDITNLLGRGRNALIFYRQNELQKDFRFSLKDPFLFGKRLNTLHSFYYREEVDSIFKSKEIGYTIQQELRLSHDYSLSYLYGISRFRSPGFDRSSPIPSDFDYTISKLQTFLVRDTRTDMLNARDGSFLTLSLTYAPEFLGSWNNYISFFGQFSFYKSLTQRLLWASNFRIGLADAFDQFLFTHNRFFAGGANSIRGFERDAVGPYDSDQDAAIGGEALFVMNQELRFSLNKWLSSVMFYDMGNVYLNLGDFNPLDVRHGVGLGLRLDIPVAFIRFDYGFNLFPKPGESRHLFYFSIGQAF
jgi:outer membrane protein assembly factor BamA/autotransporter translocation and assembly factor TamB